MQEEAFGAIRLEGPDNPAAKEDHGHGRGHVQIGIASPEQRVDDFEAMRAIDTPADRADAREEPEPVGKQDEDEDRREEPESLLDQVRPDDAFQELVKRLHQPFQEVLGARRRELHLPGGITGEQNEADPNRPGHHHRAGDKGRTGAAQPGGISRQTVFLMFGGLGFKSILDRRSRGLGLRAQAKQRGADRPPQH